jgi:hypothetical protein
LLTGIGVIDYISSTTNFHFIVNKIKIDYSHRELVMRSLEIKNSNILYILTFKQGCDI